MICAECGAENGEKYCLPCRVKVFGPSERLVECPDCGDKVRAFCVPCDTVFFSRRTFGMRTGWARMRGYTVPEWV